MLPIFKSDTLLFEKFLANQKTDDVIHFGDQRDFERMAIEAAMIRQTEACHGRPTATEGGQTLSK